MEDNKINWLFQLSKRPLPQLDCGKNKDIFIGMSLVSEFGIVLSVDVVD